MDIKIKGEVLDPLLHDTYTCTEVSWTFSVTFRLSEYSAPAEVVTTQTGAIELKFGDAIVLFRL